MQTVDLVYFNAGGGHRATALALQAVLREQQPAWQVRLVNLFEVLDPTAKFHKLTGTQPEDWYNRRLARGWTIGMAQELKLLQGLIRLGHPMLLRQLQQHWLCTEPDMVVSLVPNFNRAMLESLAATLPGVPYVTVLTDLADVPPNFWMENDHRQHLVCGTPHAVAQARAIGRPAERVHATSGMVIRPAFYAPVDVDRAAEQRRLGLDPSKPTGIVMFGGHGSKAMLGIAERLAASTQLILICGHNKALAARLEALARGAPRVVVGFCSDVPRLMHLADFFIGKPGPGSLSEAVQQGLPVVVVDNAWTMPQERYNAHWVRDNGLGIVARSFRRIDAVVAQLLADLDGHRARVRAVENRALYEVPRILAGVLREAEALQPRLRTPFDRRGRATDPHR